jgi:Ca2+/Na+ antiporter
MRGFAAFGICFGILLQVWFHHYRYFRRYGLQDTLTVILNSALLFVVLFYVYPLKFLYTLVVTTMLGDPAFTRALTHLGDGVKLMTIYGLGWIAVFAIFALLHANVWLRRTANRLTPLDSYDARTGMVSHLLAGSVGMFSVVLVLAGGDRMAAWSGMSYSLLGPVLFAWGLAAGRTRARLVAAAGAAAAAEAPATT